MVDTFQRVAPQRRVSYYLTAIWCLYLLLSPLHFFERGLPQPADYFILVFGLPALLVALVHYRGPLSSAFAYGSLFAGLTLGINLIHYYFQPDLRFIYSAGYYAFNFSLFLLVLLLFRHAPGPVNRLTYGVIAATILLQLAFALFWGGHDGVRATGSFVNPNQLAYWGVLSMACLMILKRERPFEIYDMALFAICLYLQALALSKAGLIVTALLLMIALYMNNIRWSGRALLAFILFIAGAWVLLDPGRFSVLIHDTPEISAVTERLGSLGHEADDSAAGRGYARLIEYPHYLLLGAGEGAFNRFGGTWQELHSGLATILFSYGIGGLTLFILFLAAIFRSMPRHYILILCAVLLFGVAHQNIRFSHFWIFLGICYAGRYLDGPDDQRRIGAAKSERI